MRLHVPDSWFDSLLDLSSVSERNNANLYLTVRTFLRPYRPQGEEEFIGKDQVVRWDEEDFEQWRRDFREVVEQGWNEKLWLIPSGPWGVYHPSSGEPTHIPNIRCCLRIRWAAEGEAHLRARVYRLHPKDHFSRSSMRFPDCRGRLRRLTEGIQSALGQASPTEGFLDHLDLKPKRSGQLTVLHEMGHYLGLSHPACHGNQDACYGATPYQQGDLMGEGARIEAWHAYPWIRRLRRHLVPDLFHATFRGTTERPSPSPMPRLYPAHNNRLDGGMPPGGMPPPSPRSSLDLGVLQGFRHRVHGQSV